MRDARFGCRYAPVPRRYLATRPGSSLERSTRLAIGQNLHTHSAGTSRRLAHLGRGGGGCLEAGRILILWGTITDSNNHQNKKL